MKALSIKQPWLYCITDLDKRVENRTWKPPDWIVGQRIALHASKTMDDLMSKKKASELAGFKLSSVAVDMPLGAIVATAVVDGYVYRSDDGRIYATKRELGVFAKSNKWFFGPYGWVLSDIQKLPEPIPYRGRLGLWSVPASVLGQ